MLTRASLSRPISRALSRSLHGPGESFDPLSLNPILAFEASRSMMAPLASESLDLDPANPSSLDVITATRAGTATYTDASGNIQTASPNTVRVDHVQGEQLTPAKFQYVGNTDLSDWGSGGITTSTDGTLAPDGNIANKYVQGDGLNSRSVSTQQTIAVSNNTYAFSSYIKNAGFDRAHYYVTSIGGAGVAKGSLELTTGTFSRQGATGDFSNVVYSFEDAGNGWYRFIMSFDVASASGTGFILRIYPEESDGSGFTGNGVDGIYIAMPQVEEGAITDFVENTTGSPKYFAAATYAPRVPMILVEPAATNLVSYTDFSSGWLNNGSSDVAGSGYSGEPSVVITGTQNNASLFFYCPAVVGQEYIISMYIRRVSGTGTIRMRHVYAVEGVATDLTITNDWSRVEVPFTANSTSIPVGPQMAVNGDSVEIAMPQVEQGTVATSFIPTSGSTVTRAADDLVIDGSDFTNFYNTDEGTVYAEYEPRVLGTTNTLLEFSDGSTDNRIFSLAASAYHCYIVDGGVNQAVLDGGNSTAGVLIRVAFSYEANNIQASLDGGAVVNDTSASIPTVDRLILGNQTVANTRLLNGHIKRVIYWPHHSDNL